MKIPGILPGLVLAQLAGCTTDSGPSNASESGALPPESRATNVVNPAPARSAPTGMKGFKGNIEQATRANSNFRKVLYTGPHLQLVLMSLKPGEEIGSETHNSADHFFRLEGGTGQCVVNDHTYTVGDGDVVVVPAGSAHNIINTNATQALKLSTIYAPPQHQDGTVRATRQAATHNETRFDGKTTE